MLLIREGQAIVPGRKEEPHGTDCKHKNDAEDLEHQKQTVVVLEGSLQDDVQHDGQTQDRTEQGRNVVVVPGGSGNQTERKPVGKETDPDRKRVEGMVIKGHFQVTQERSRWCSCVVAALGLFLESLSGRVEALLDQNEVLCLEDLVLD